MGKIIDWIEANLLGFPVMYKEKDKINAMITNLWLKEKDNKKIDIKEITRNFELYFDADTEGIKKQLYIA